jgi:hypothetical protein
VVVDIDAMRFGLRQRFRYEAGRGSGAERECGRAADQKTAAIKALR